MQRLPPALVLVAALAGCSKDEPPPPERTEPWRATPVEETEGHLVERYAIESGTATLVLPAKEAKPRGTLRVAKGQLEVDLLDLERTRGSVSIDLASVVMQGEEPDAGVDQDFTRAAQNWLDVGSSKPDAERERLRWARFSITAIDDASASAAHDGKRLKPEPAADAEADAAPSSAELRRVDLTASGDLLVHNRKVERSLRLRVTFRYPVAATPGAKPELIRIETRRPLVVSLAAHDIRPRNSAGVLISKDMPLIGTRVGREARVELDLRAIPAK